MNLANGRQCYGYFNPSRIQSSINGGNVVAQYVESNGFGPCVLCMHRRELPDIQMIRT